MNNKLNEMKNEMCIKDNEMGTLNEEMKEKWNRERELGDEMDRFSQNKC